MESGCARPLEGGAQPPGAEKARCSCVAQSEQGRGSSKHSFSRIGKAGYVLK